MQASSREPPSMLELCETFRKRKERLWNLNGDFSELEEDPCHQRIMSRALSTQRTTEQQAERSIDAGGDLKRRSTHARRSRKSCHELASPSFDTDEGNDGYVKRRDSVRLSTLHPQMAYSMKQNRSRISSDEEYYVLDTRASPSQKQNTCSNAKDSGQTEEIYRPSSDELTAPSRRGKGTCRNRAAEEVKNTHRYLPLNQLQAKEETLNHSSFRSQEENREARKQGKGRKIGLCQGMDCTQAQPRTLVREVIAEHRSTQTYLSQGRIENLSPVLPIQSFQGNRDTAVPGMLNRIDEHCEVRVFEAFRARRHGRQEVCEEGKQRRRRTGVCQVSDATAEHRTFLRVLNKRF